MSEIAFTIKDATRVTGLARSRIYELLGTGELEARKAGRRTLIMGDSLREYINSLPHAQIGPAKDS